MNQEDFRSFWKRSQPKILVEEQNVTEQIAKYQREVYRFDDAYHALTWYLTHGGKGVRGFSSVEHGVEYFIYVQKANRTACTPRLRVVYTETESEIVIKSLEIG
jgi:hypothetical protein